MCSTTDRTDGTSTGADLAVLVGHFHELAVTIATRVVDPGTDLPALPVDAVAAQLRHLLAACDQGRAAATVLTGVVDRAVSARQLIDGTYASTKRFLEVEAGLSQRSATALTARARDLRDAADNGDVRLRYAWLAGVLSDDKVRELTVGIRTAVKHLPAGERDVVTRQALDLLLPLAPTQTVAELRRAVSRLRFVLDPDGIRQAELDAYTEQSLTCVPVGHLLRVQAYLEPEAAAALMTVLDQQVTGWLRDDALAPRSGCPTASRPTRPRAAVSSALASRTCARSLSARRCPGCSAAPMWACTTASAPTPSSTSTSATWRLAWAASSRCRDATMPSCSRARRYAGSSATRGSRTSSPAAADPPGRARSAACRS